MQKKYSLFKKNSYSFIICLFLFLVMFSSNINGQDEDIFLTAWFLESLTINEEEFPFSANDEINSITLFVDFINEYEDIFYYSQVCDELFGIATFFEMNNESFMSINDFQLEHYIDCELEESFEYETLYFDFLTGSYNNSTFAYEIIDNTTFSTLILTSSTGDIAIYNTINLSTQDFSKPTFTVYPNPAKDILYIENPNDILITEIVVYDSLGKQLIKLSDITDTIDVSNLTKGIYFMTLKTSTTITNKKIIVR